MKTIGESKEIEEGTITKLNSYMLETPWEEVSELYYFAKDEDIISVIISYISLLETILKHQYDFKDCFKSTLVSIINQEPYEINSKDREKFFRYCYILKECAFQTLGQAYPYGVSYAEFIEEILMDVGINEISKKNKDLLSGRFRTYLSDITRERGNFWKILYYVRSSQVKLVERNENNGESYITTIGMREKMAFEFEFFIKIKNKTDDLQNPEMNEIINLLKQEAERRLIPIFEEQGFANPAMKFHKYQKRYAALIVKRIAEMSDDELKEYLKFMDCKNAYIRKYSKDDPFIGALGAQYLSYTMGYNLVEEKYCSHLKEMDFLIVGGTMAYIIECCPRIDKNDTIMTVKWNGMLFLFNLMDKILNGGLIEEVKLDISKSYYDYTNNIEKFSLFRRICAEEPYLNTEKSKREIKIKFLNVLRKNNKGWKNLIKISISTKMIISWTIKRDSEIWEYESFIKTQYKKLGQAFSYIFYFLKCCNEKAIESKKCNEEQISIKELIEDLKSNLEKNNIMLNSSCFSSCYINEENIERKKSKYYWKYFEECIETAEARLYLMIKEKIEKKRKIGVESFVQDYLKSILDRRIGEELIVPKKYKKDLSNVIFNDMILSLYPSQRTAPENKKTLLNMKRLLNIAERYGFKKSIYIE